MSIPSTEQVQAYLAAYQIESVVEEAVNDAVLTQAKDPYAHIAQLLMQHSIKSGAAAAGSEGKDGRRVSLGGVPLVGNQRKVSLSMETFEQEQAKEKKTTMVVPLETHPAAGEKPPNPAWGEKLERKYEKTEVPMLPEVETLLKTFFDKMDANQEGSVTKEKAIAFWGKNFAKVNATSMFNEVDENGDEAISWDEFLAFWKNVVGSGYSQDDILEEVQMMLEGGSWVDFDDGRTT